MPLFGAPGERIGYQLYPHPAGAPPIVLVHGLSASSASFITNLPALRERFTVLTVELLGHGDSEAPEGVEPYLPEAQIARILALASHLGMERFLLCGHSLGGGVVIRLALDAPQRLTGLIVINSNAAAGTTEWRDRSRPGMLQTATRIRAEGTGFLRDTWIYPAASRRMTEEARTALARDFERITPAGLAGTYEGLVANVNAWDRLPKLAVRTLLVIGTRDQGFVRNSVPFIAQLPAHLLQVVRIDSAGHAANLEAPAAFETALFAFARGLEIIA
jgi:pimeloyl-ACP methyl ester carboxylesterase